MDDQLLSVVTAAIFLAIFVLTTIDLVRYRTRMHLEVALLFGSLAGILALSGLSTVAGIKLQRTGIAAVYLVILQPYLLVRLVDYFRPIALRQHVIGVAGIVYSWALIAVALLGPDHRPPGWTAVPVLVWIGYMEAYAAMMFLHSARRSSGVTRRRVIAVALGATLLAAIIAVIAIQVAIRNYRSAFRLATNLLLLASAISFYLGFVPPRWLRRTWQLAELQYFLAALSGRSARERLSLALDEVGPAAARAVGGKAGVVAVGGEHAERLLIHAAAEQVRSLGGDASMSVGPESLVLSAAWQGRRPVASSDVHEWGPALRRLAEACGGARGALIAPLVASGRLYGVLIVLLERGPLFAEDEIALLQVLAEQAALAIDAGQLMAEIDRERKTLAAVMAGMRDGLLVFDSERHVRYGNHRAGELLGIDPQALVGEPASAVWEQARPAVASPDTAEAALAQMLAHPDDDEDMTLTLTAPVRRELDVSSFPVATETETGIALLLHDVTREREVDRMKDEFVSLVSHELRTPLASVLGFTELLLDREWAPERRREFLETMHKEATRLKLLIDDFLDLQRMESGRQEYAKEVLQVGDLVEDASAPLRLQQNGHVIRTDIPEGLPPIVGDRGRLVQVLLNLLGNAVKYSPSGGEVLVTARQVGNRLEVAVADQGLGLPADAIPKLFQKFYRVDTSDRREIGGTGLGLAICREIVEAQGGRIWAESAGPGQGSTFGFTLPAATDELVAAMDGDTPGPATVNGEHAPEASPGGQVAPAAAARPRVLVVEDEDNLIALYRVHLEPAGYDVVGAKDGATALAMARAAPPDAVVLDILLPGRLDGWDVLTQLKMDPATRHVPVVVATILDDTQHGAALGAVDFLVKPIDMGRLLRTLAAHVSPGQRDILVVDDDASLRKLLCETLQQHGFTCREAGDGTAALEEIAQHRPDLVLLDLAMPRMDGFGVLQRLRNGSLAPPDGTGALRDLPVIILTGQNLTAEERALLAKQSAVLIQKDDDPAAAVLRALEQQIPALAVRAETATPAAAAPSIASAVPGAAAPGAEHTTDQPGGRI